MVQCEWSLSPLSAPCSILVAALVSACGQGSSSSSCATLRSGKRGLCAGVNSGLLCLGAFGYRLLNTLGFFIIWFTLLYLLEVLKFCWFLVFILVFTFLVHFLVNLGRRQGKYTHSAFFIATGNFLVISVSSFFILYNINSVTKSFENFLPNPSVNCLCPPAAAIWSLQQPPHWPISFQHEPSKLISYVTKSSFLNSLLLCHSILKNWMAILFFLNTLSLNFSFWFFSFESLIHYSSHTFNCSQVFILNTPQILQMTGKA